MKIKRVGIMDRDVIVEKLQEYYESNKETAFIYLFGSYAKGRNSRNSDIDVAVYLNDNASEEAFEYKLKETGCLQNLLKKNVDVVILNNASPILANQVFRHGILIKCFDNRLLSKFRVENFYKYLDQVRLSNMIFRRNKQRIKESLGNG